MKKLFALVLALAMAFSLVSCGSGAPAADTSGEKPSASAPADGSAAPAEDAGAPAEDAGAPAADAGAYDTITLTTATSSNETEFSGMIMAHFKEIVEEKSGGAVTVEIYYGGSFCGDPEVPQYVMDGTLNLDFVMPAYHWSFFPLSAGFATYTSNQDAVDVCNSLIWDNPETGALIQAQANANNLEILGHTSAGKSVFLSRSEITGMDDTEGRTLGSPINLDLYEAMGYNTTAVEPPDMYDSLSRGVCDTVAFAAPIALTMNLFEVAPNMGDAGLYFSNQIVALNLDTWNGLNEATQELLKECTIETAKWSCDYADSVFQDLVDACEAAGGVVNTYPDGEGKEFIEASQKSMYVPLRSFAENLGCTEEMETLIAAWNAELGIVE